MELGPAPRRGPRAPPAAGPSAPSLRCIRDPEPCTRGKPTCWSNPCPNSRREGGKQESPPLLLSHILPLLGCLAALRPSQPPQSLLPLVGLCILALPARCNVKFPLPTGRRLAAKATLLAKTGTAKCTAPGMSLLSCGGKFSTGPRKGA